MSVHDQLIQAYTQLGYNNHSDGICRGTTIRWLEACLLGEEDVFLQRIEHILSNNVIDRLDILAFFDSLHLFQSPDQNTALFQVNYDQAYINAISLIASSDKIVEAGGLTPISLSINNYIPQEDTIIAFLNDLGKTIDSLVLPPPEITALLLSGCKHSTGLTYNTASGWTYMNINTYPPKKFSNEETETLSKMIFEGFIFEEDTNSSIRIHTIFLTTQGNKYRPQLSDAFERLNIKNNAWITEKTALGSETTNMIYTAATYGHHLVIAELRKYHGVDLNQANNKKFTPAHMAAQHGHHLVIAELGKYHNVDLNQANDEGFTPAHMAAWQGHPLVIAELAKLHADLDKKTNDGATPVYFAAHYGHSSVIAELAKYSVELLNQLDHNGFTLAHIAAQYGYHLMIAELGKYLGVDFFNQPDHRGFTPAHVAAQQEHPLVIAELAKLHADLDKKTNDGATPAYLAVHYGHSSVIAELAKYSVELLNQLDRNGFTLAHIAAQYGHHLMIAELGKYLDVDFFNQPDHQGFTPAHIAAQQGYPLVIAELAKLHVDINKTNHAGQTAAFIAAYHGHDSILTELAKYSADFNQSDHRKFTPAHAAAQQGHHLVILTLAAYSAALDTTDIYECTPAHWAAKEGRISVLIELAKHSADLMNKETNGGVTPAFLAAQYNQAEALEQLIDLGADCTITYTSTVSEARKSILSTKDNAIIARLELYIEQKVSQRRGGFFDGSFFSCRGRLSDNTIISVPPLEIAAIMGHEQIINILSDHKSGFSLN